MTTLVNRQQIGWSLSEVNIKMPPRSNFLRISPSFFPLRSKSDSQTAPHLSRRGQNVFQMTFSWQVVCPLISLAFSICLATSETKDVVNLYLSPASVFVLLSICLSETSGTDYPCVSSSFYPVETFFCQLHLLSVFHEDDRHSLAALRVVECHMKKL